MELRTLPGSDLKVSPLCMGCWQFNDSFSEDVQWPPQTYEVSKSIVDKALECGINFFDTAEAYLNSEDVVGRVLEGRRRGVVLASKFGYRDGRVAYSPEHIEESLTISLRKLKTDYLDLYQVHWPPNLEGASLEQGLAELERQKARGRIRYYSVCNFGVSNLERLLAAGGKPLTNQVAYNLLWRGAEVRLQPVCAQNDVSLLAYSPLQQGLLTGNFPTVDSVPPGRRRTRLFHNDRNPKSVHGGDGAEKETFQTLARIAEIAKEAGQPMASVSLSWLLQQPSVASVIVGASRPDQVAANAKLVTLKQEIVDRLSLASDELKTLFDGALDMWNHNRVDS